MKPEPIFIFSLPRSGSTWLQRIISSHPDVATITEPWFLLPALSATKNHFSFQVYDHQLCLMGIESALLSNGHQSKWRSRYFAGVAAMAENIYSNFSGDCRLFLDKTPRYSLICEEIIQTFPDAKFIFLWRHPFSIVSSIHKTWANESWVMPKYEVDLYDGLLNLITVSQKYTGKIFVLQYEELYDQPIESVKKLFSYLGLDYRDNILEDARRHIIHGDMGDPNQHNERAILAGSDWTNAAISFSKNKFYKFWLKKYLIYIGPERMQRMGYDFHQSLSVLDGIKPNSFGVFDYLNDTSFELRRYLIYRLAINPLDRDSVYFRHSK